MSDEPLPRCEIILHQTEDGRTRIQHPFTDESLWLTQAPITMRFETTQQNVHLHLKCISAKSAPGEPATCTDTYELNQKAITRATSFLMHHPNWVKTPATAEC